MELKYCQGVAVLVIGVTLCLEVVKGSMYCYECSSASPLCRDSVWDGQYLSVMPCQSSCFMRQQNNAVYRGCFDGWLGGVVRNDYSGCRVQRYLGESVEWCFCRGTDDKAKVCNGASREKLMKRQYSLKPSYKQIEKSVTSEPETTYVVEEYPIHEYGYGSYNSVYDSNDAYRDVPEQGSDPKEEEYNRAAYKEAPDTYENDAQISRYNDADYASQNQVEPYKPLPYRQSSVMDNPCERRSDGPYPDEKDCASYYICSGGMSYHMQCPAGTVWNQVLQGCSYSFHPQFPYDDLSEIQVDSTKEERQSDKPYQQQQYWEESPDINDDSLDVEMDSRNEERQSDRPYQRQQYWRESPDTIQCYSCNDYSPFCGFYIETPSFVAVTTCRTKCFIRRENDRIYRGCYDGWESTKVRDDYDGCRKQGYYRDPIDWCFCNNDLCNGVSMPDLAAGRTTLPPTGDQYLATTPYPNNQDALREGARDHYMDEFIYYHAPVLKRGPLDGKSMVGMCRGYADGLYADPFDCARFVHCFSGFTYRRFCPAGTVWNDIQMNCDYPYKVDHYCEPKKAIPYIVTLDSDLGKEEKEQTSISRATSEVHGQGDAEKTGSLLTFYERK